jgi:glycosyltransferase involved in cell wall biosynthesis
VFLLKFIFGKKWVCDFRTSPIAQEVEFRRFKGTLSWGRRLIYRVARLFYRISLKYCDLVVAISDEIRQELVEDYKVPMENVYVQPLGVDLELFKPAHLADEIDGELRLVYIGAIAPQRGLDTVLRAVNLLKGRVPLRLILVGGGEQVSIQNLKILAERLGVSEQVDWVGYIPHDQIPRVLDTCHVALSPLPALQAYQVSSPAKVVEYLAMGKIVIATDIRAHQKLITDGENGLLIPSEDPASLAVAIERIYSDRELRHRLTKNARQSVHAYGWDEMLPKLEERIQALLK